MIQLNVVNKELQVGAIRIMGVGSASVVLIGDTEAIATSSIFDTPPESLIIGPLVPFAPEAGGR
ncbi:spore gernimation protein GerPD [Gorillibacterium sp. sgz5001074]|uniref:spore gernimation protein GerPD n=1 Tax=Gorillibacterium sp. sgz5001074 TaxID=3446695 RepID=UPI003F672577